MRFWDSSGILPLLVTEGGTKGRKSFLQADHLMAVWWGSRVECASALNRLQRADALGKDGLVQALGDLEMLAASWFEIQPSEQVRTRALRLLRVHPLRAADALQLAAALVAAGEDPAGLVFVTSDDRLQEAAAKEGFMVV